MVIGGIPMTNNRIQVGIGERIFNILNIAFMVFIMMITLYPMLYVAFASFSTPGKFMMHYGPLWYPLDFNLVSFRAVFRNPNISLSLI